MTNRILATALVLLSTTGAGAAVAALGISDGSPEADAGLPLPGNSNGIAAPQQGGRAEAPNEESSVTGAPTTDEPKGEETEAKSSSKSRRVTSVIAKFASEEAPEASFHADLYLPEADSFESVLPPQGGSKADPAKADASKADAPTGPKGASPIFAKKERDDLYKKFAKYMDTRRERERVRDAGPDSNEYKQADKRAKDAEKDYFNELGKLGKKYKLDALCLTAVADWHWLFNEYVAEKRKFVTSDKKLGAEQGDQLRDEPRASFTRRVPKNYDPKAKAWPLLLILQDKGRASKLALTEDLKSPMLLDGDAEKQGAIVISIDVPEVAWSDPKQLQRAVFYVFRDTRNLYRIDPNRVAIGGLGEGVQAALSVVASDPRHFSAFVAKGGNASAAKADSFCSIPMFVFGPNDGWTSFEARAKEVGCDLTLQADAKADDVAAWLSSKTRKTYTDRVVFCPPTENARRAWNWLKIDPDPQALGRIEAKIDAATNTIHVECDGVTQYTLLLSDALVDLSRPVIVKTNGDTQKPWTDKLPPSIDEILNSFGEFMSKDTLSEVSDQGFIYTAKHTIAVRQRKKEKKADDPGAGTAK
ncbi:MAG: hypothetical protein JNJ88_12320 [Planctomycetes bacterium]|nr:hypothetical protein [Planctomycetota bacterium]